MGTGKIKSFIVWTYNKRMVSGLTFRYPSIKFQHAVQTTYQLPCTYLMDAPYPFSLAFVAKVGKSNLTPDFIVSALFFSLLGWIVYRRVSNKNKNS